MTIIEDDTELAGRRSIGARRNPQSQEAILDAAEALLSEAGTAGFSIEAVARRARAGKPTIYRWWPNRTLLLLDVYKRFKTRRRTLPDTGSLRGDLIAFLNEHLLGFWRDRLCATVYRSLIAEAQSDAGASQALQAYQHERKAIASAMIDRAVARGEVGQGADAGLIIDLMVSFAWHQLLIDRVEEAMSEIEPAVDMILGGVPGYRPAN